MRHTPPGARFDRLAHVRLRDDELSAAHATIPLVPGAYQVRHAAALAGDRERPFDPGGRRRARRRRSGEHRTGAGSGRRALLVEDLPSWSSARRASSVASSPSLHGGPSGVECCQRAVHSGYRARCGRGRARGAPTPRPASWRRMLSCASIRNARRCRLRPRRPRSPARAGEGLVEASVERPSTRSAWRPTGCATRGSAPAPRTRRPRSQPTPNDRRPACRR